MTPSTNTAITEATTYTYTYAQKESAVDPAPDTPSSSDDETYFFVPDGTKDDEVATAKDPTYQWRKNSGDSLLFVIKSVSNDDQTFGKFKGGVCVDGNVVDSKYFTAATGSLRLTLKLEYLNTLSVGEHTLTIQFEELSAPGHFRCRCGLCHVQTEKGCCVSKSLFSISTCADGAVRFLAR